MSIAEENIMPPSEFIDQFDVLLFDMGRTIMFDGDRFDESQDYERTYRILGGSHLTNRELDRYINFIYGSLLTRSPDEKFLDYMIKADEFMRTDICFNKLKGEDKVLLEQVFAIHECGAVNESCKRTLVKL